MVDVEIVTQMPEKQVGDELEKATQIESRILPPHYFANNASSMRLMVEHRIKGDSDPIVGRVFETGIGGNVAALCLLPQPYSDTFFDVLKSSGRPGESGVRARDIVVGTPAMIVVEDAKLKDKLDGDPKTDGERFVDSWREKMRRVYEGKALGAVRAGGWGSDPTASLGVAELQLGHRDKTGRVYESVTVAGFFGSMDTVNPMLNLSTNSNTLNEVRLSMFPWQLETMLNGFAQWADGSSDGKVDSAKYTQYISGHSMMGYVLLAALRKQTGLTTIESMKRQGAKFVIEKPVLVGDRFPKDQMPDWMYEITTSSSYSEHVPFLRGPKGALIRAGLDNYWWNRGSLSELRRGTIEKEGPISLEFLFNNLLSPDVIFDGANISRGHRLSYAHYRNFHGFCTRLLDTASPIMGDNTVALGHDWGNTYITIGDKDNILHHGSKQPGELGWDLLQYLGIDGSHTYWSADGAHYPDIEELLWSMG